MTPLIVFIGFLGAGKTTLLRGLLPPLTAAGLDPQVILNDYQNAGVDAGPLSGLAGSVVPISGNCVCCGSRDEMFDALAKARLSPKSVMLIEANGTADAAQLVELLSCDLRAVRYTLPLQLGVVDARRWQRRNESNRLEAAQLETATHLYLSHADDAGSDADDAVMAAVNRINPHAAWICEESFACEVVQLSLASTGLSPRVLRKPSDPVETPHHGHSARHRHAEHHFASLELPLRDGLERDRLESFLHALPAGVIRAKGLVRLADQDGEYTVFDFLGADRFHRLRSYAALPPVAPLFLAIGPHLPEAELRAAVRRLNQTPALHA
jgi:G3E family GTPase